MRTAPKFFAGMFGNEVFASMFGSSDATPDTAGYLPSNAATTTSVTDRFRALTVRKMPPVAEMEDELPEVCCLLSDDFYSNISLTRPAPHPDTLSGPPLDQSRSLRHRFRVPRRFRRHPPCPAAPFSLSPCSYLTSLQLSNPNIPPKILHSLFSLIDTVLRSAQTVDVVRSVLVRVSTAVQKRPYLAFDPDNSILSILVHHFLKFSNSHYHDVRLIASTAFALLIRFDFNRLTESHPSGPTSIASATSVE